MATFSLTTGNDSFTGTSRNDTFQDFRPGGSDALDGGLGTDTFFAQVRNAHMVVDLGFDSGAQLSLASDPNAWAPGARSINRYNFVDIENIEIANSGGLTILRGDSMNNYLFIESGGGFLGGGAGDDRLSTFGGGVDFDGGPGNDTLSASFEAGRGAVSVRGGEGFDTFKTYTDAGGFSLNNLDVSPIDGGLLLTGGSVQITLYNDVEEFRVNELFNPGPPSK
ncbi:hypothetical protein J7426_25080, partial [Tropicibacter sp. R16_0]|nr:hypothetical protein [Tropicibacter sp. R16_0]